MKKCYCVFIFSLLLVCLQAQVRWTNVDSLFSPLPAALHIYKTTDLLDGKPNIAYYAEADLKSKAIEFIADTTLGRRLTPAQFYAKNNQPLLVVNCTFFSFATNQNLNAVISKGRLVSYNVHSIPGRGSDTLTYWHVLGSAIGISKKRKADVAWLYTDTAAQYPVAFEKAPVTEKNASPDNSKYTFAPFLHHAPTGKKKKEVIEKWKMETAVGGGPVLLQNGEIKITNNEERKFAGNAINDKHPRTAMGYTATGKLIILIIEGRNPGVAEGATLMQEAQLFKDLGCVEALNLDGGGSSCMLVNGKQTIRPSDKEGQRPVPAVFIISQR